MIWMRLKKGLALRMGLVLGIGVVLLWSPAGCSKINSEEKDPQESRAEGARTGERPPGKEANKTQGAAMSGRKASGLNGETKGEATPPSKQAGLHSETLRLTSLKGEFSDPAKAKLRMRLITVEPGGHTAQHVHIGRPGIVYIVSGAIYNHAKGKLAQKVSAGEIFYETRGYTHYIENRGKVAATLISADIVTGSEE